MGRWHSRNGLAPLQVFHAVLSPSFPAAAGTWVSLSKDADLHQIDAGFSLRFFKEHDLKVDYQSRDFARLAAEGFLWASPCVLNKRMVGIINRD
jgi:hypothetical protein